MEHGLITKIIINLMAVLFVGVKVLLPEEPMAGLSPGTGAQGIVVHITLLMALPPNVWCGMVLHVFHDNQFAREPVNLV